MLFGLLLGAALYEAAQDDYTPVTKVTYTPPRVTTTRTTTRYTRTIYSESTLAHKLWNNVCFYEHMSNSELDLAVARAYRWLDTDVKNQIYDYKVERTIKSTKYLTTCEVTIRINYSKPITVYYEVR
jgi:hypothetical protein